MNLHICTLTWNGETKLASLFPGLTNNIKNIQTEFDNIVWHIRDNGSTDNTKQLISGWRNLNINLYEIGHNRDNFATCINYLVAKANPGDNDLILFLNNDIQFFNDNSLLNMITLLKSTNAAVCGARLLYNKTNNLQHAGVIFGENYGRMPYHFRHGEPSNANTEANRYFQAVTAALCLVKADIFKKVDGFCNEFFWAFEDIDFCLKVKQLGENIVYCGSTGVYHEESATLKKNPVNKLFLKHNVNLFKNKWFGKYKLDHERYLNDPLYNEIKV